MSKLYFYFQRVGGEEEWTPIQADQNIAAAKPTFITVLALDTLLEEHPQREVLEATKYQGPMYFDLDSETIGDSIEGGKALLAKLGESGLKDSDIEIYLSGKKGLHFVISPVCFMEKVQPLQRLPAIYKEMAFKLAVDTVDFKVYTARKGRMLRTCYNIRENGNYRVPVTADELRSLTPETYDSLCKVPRGVGMSSPQFRPEFALIFDAAQQKIASIKRRKPKPVTTQELQRALPEIQQILKGENLSDIGFNKIAIQLCVYARESKWTEDVLVQNAKQLCEKHQSDGYRYGTPAKRESELRRMFSYVDDNPAYEYSIDFLRSCLKRDPINVPRTEEGEEVYDFTLSGGVSVRGNSYMVIKGEDGEAEISNFVFRSSELMLDRSDGRILAIRTIISGGAKVTLSPNNFTSSSTLQNTVSSFGRSFTGSDVHARGVYQLMLKEVSKTSYIVDSEGLNYITLPAHPDPELAQTPFLAWADRYRVVVPAWVREKDVKLEFLGFPEEKGVLQTDLTLAPPPAEWLASQENKQLMAQCFRDLFESSQVETIAKSLGWMVAAHYKPLFQAQHGQFPLLHIFGPAGMGKTQLMLGLLHMFYFKSKPQATTPSSTHFAFLTLVAGSASIPVLLDEWKPGSMNREIAEKYRGTLRDIYNSKETQRGGGSRTKDVFNALNKVELSAPVIFVSEAADTETAILERSVPLTFKRTGKLALGSTTKYFRRFQNNLMPLTIIGKALAGNLLQDGSEDRFKKEFDPMLEWANGYYMTQEDDDEKLASGELTQSDFDRKRKNAPRPVFNSTVVLFGLVQVRKLLQAMLGDLFDDYFVAKFKELNKAAYSGLAMGVAMLPEYIKVLSAMSDMSRAGPSNSTDKYLTDGVDYNLSEIGGKAVLVLASRFAYNKYRQFTKLIGQTAMYPNETSFEMAMSEIPQFLQKGYGTKNLVADTVILDLELLIQSGVPPFAGKTTTLNF